LVASAKLHGATLSPETPRTYPSFLEVLSERPSFVNIVLNAPVGYLDTPESGVRSCDRQARALLGRRGAAIRNAPTRAVLDEVMTWREAGMDAVSATQLPRVREISLEMSPFRQRVVYEGNPELSFYQLRADSPLERSKNIEMGRAERRAILISKVPGIESVLDADLEGVPLKHLYDAAALLWTARRVFGHAAKRIPVEPEWDGAGLRMEMVY